MGRPKIKMDKFESTLYCIINRRVCQEKVGGEKNFPCQAQILMRIFSHIPFIIQIVADDTTIGTILSKICFVFSIAKSSGADASLVGMDFRAVGDAGPYNI